MIMRGLNVALVFALLGIVTVLSAPTPNPNPTPLPKNVFRPDSIGMGYKDRVADRPRKFLPFPGKFGVVLDKSNTPRPDEPDQVDRVDSVDSVDRD